MGAPAGVTLEVLQWMKEQMGAFMENYSQAQATRGRSGSRRERDEVFREKGGRVVLDEKYSRRMDNFEDRSAEDGYLTYWLRWVKWMGS